MTLTPEMEAKIDHVACETADFFAAVLQQRYEQIDGVWWLISLNKPVRPLTAEEVEDAKQHGVIK